MYYQYFLTFLLIGATGNEVSEDTLVLVHAVTRHGARTPEPITSFPKDLYKNLTYYPYGEGELNQEGIKTSFELGKELRKRYEKFLGPKYHPGIVEALSSGATRCRATTQLILAGMFPPYPSQTFQEGLEWQPIPYQYTDRNTDLMIAFIRCLKFMLAVPLNLEFNECKDRDYMNQYLTENTGMDVQSLMSVFFVFDTLKSEIENGLSLPTWAKPIWPEPLSTCSFDYWRHFANNRTVLGVMGGIFMKKLLDNTKENINGNSNLENGKFFLYVGHEHNIYLFLGMLGSFNNIAENYLAYALFEVHKINDVYGFKVYWDNRDEMGLRQIEIPKCGTFCPVDRFYELMDIYVKSETCP